MDEFYYYPEQPFISKRNVEALLIDIDKPFQIEWQMISRRNLIWTFGTKEERDLVYFLIKKRHCDNNLYVAMLQKKGESQYLKKSECLKTTE